MTCKKQILWWFYQYLYTVAQGAGATSVRHLYLLLLEDMLLLGLVVAVHGSRVSVYHFQVLGHNMCSRLLLLYHLSQLQRTEGPNKRRS